MTSNTRAIVNFTVEQYARLKIEADKLGLSVPAFCRVSALEKIKDA